MQCEAKLQPQLNQRGGNQTWPRLLRSCKDASASLRAATSWRHINILTATARLPPAEWDEVTILYTPYGNDPNLTKSIHPASGASMRREVDARTENTTL